MVKGPVRELRFKYRDASKGSITKEDIIKKVSEASGIHQKDVALIYMLIFKIIKDSLIKGFNAKIRDFGWFMLRNTPKDKRGRIGFGNRRGDNDMYRYRKGESIISPSRVVIKFFLDEQLKKDVWAAAIKRGDCPPAIRHFAETGEPVETDVAIWT